MNITVFKIFVLFLFSKQIVMSASTDKPSIKSQLEYVNKIKKIIHLYSNSKNKIATTTRRVTITNKLSEHDLMKKKAQKKIQEFRKLWTPKTTVKLTPKPPIMDEAEIKRLITMYLASRPIDYSSHEIGDYDDEFTYRLIDKYKRFNNLFHQMKSKNE